MTTALGLLLLNSCAVAIHDEQFCSPIPGNVGAVCDNFLTSNPLALTEQEWISLQSSWMASGQATECTTSQTVGDIKGEIEKLCYVYPCDIPTQAKLVNGLKKIEHLGVQ
jgi:hypothetical protein